MAKGVRTNPLKAVEQDGAGEVTGEVKAEKQYNVAGVVVSESVLNVVLSVLIKLPWDVSNSTIEYVQKNAKLVVEQEA